MVNSVVLLQTVARIWRFQNPHLVDMFVLGTTRKLGEIFHFNHGPLPSFGLPDPIFTFAFTYLSLRNNMAPDSNFNLVIIYTTSFPIHKYVFLFYFYRNLLIFFGFTISISYHFCFYWIWFIIVVVLRNNAALLNFPLF